jgi:hypothetical protein
MMNILYGEKKREEKDIWEKKRRKDVRERKYKWRE